MSHQTPGSRHPVTRALLTILILAPIVGTLWVPFYARTTPKVADFPFFYWYQLLWVPVAAVTTGLAYALMRRIGRPRGGPGTAVGPDAQRPGNGGGTVQAP